MGFAAICPSYAYAGPRSAPRLRRTGKAKHNPFRRKAAGVLNAGIASFHIFGVAVIETEIITTENGRAATGF